MDPSRLDGPGQSGPLTDTSPGSARSPGLKGRPRGSFGRRSSVHTLSFEPNASPFLAFQAEVKRLRARIKEITAPRVDPVDDKWQALLATDLEAGVADRRGERSAGSARRCPHSPSRSEISVKPAMSANNAVTCRRSPDGAPEFVGVAAASL